MQGLLTVKPLNASFGAEVLGFDAANITPEAAHALNRAFLDHRVLIIRGKPISDDELVALGKCFGPVEMSRSHSPLASRPEIMVVSNIRADGKPLGQHPDGELVWHFDRVHQPVPNKAGILQALEIPSAGGETLFADMCGVFDSLPASTKQKLEGLSAKNTFTYGANQAQEKKGDASSPAAVHPAVRTIPETGRRALYVCRLMTDRLNELPEAESSELLDDLFEQSEDSRFTYSHTWRVGDIVVWDNRCTMHARNDFNGEERRLLKRVTIGDHLAPAA